MASVMQLAAITRRTTCSKWRHSASLWHAVRVRRPQYTSVACAAGLGNVCGSARAQASGMACAQQRHVRLTFAHKRKHTGSERWGFSRAMAADGAGADARYWRRQLVCVVCPSVVPYNGAHGTSHHTPPSGPSRQSRPLAIGKAPDTSTRRGLRSDPHRLCPRQQARPGHCS